MATALLTFTYFISSFLVIASNIKLSPSLTKPLRLIVLFIVIAYYFYGMFRIDGVDFNSYVNYFNFPEDISDPGFRALVYIANLLSVEFSYFLLFQAVFTVCAIKRLSNSLNSDFLLAFSIFLIHSAVVRDFSQSRVALAVAFIFLAYSYTGNLRKQFYLIIATSIHLTVAVPIIIFFVSNRIALLGKFIIFFVILISALMAILIKSHIVPALFFIDPRIEMYLNFTDDFYGNAVLNFKTLFFYGSLYLMALFSYSSTKDIFYLKFSLYVFFGIIIFYLFSNVAILSYRLASLSIIFYPFVISKIYLDLINFNLLKVPRKNFQILKVALNLAAIIIIFSGYRQGTSEIMNSIVPIFDFI
jgi:hypothetical protein